MRNGSVAGSADRTSALAPEMLYRRCDQSRLTFATTAELAPLAHAPGQARAIEAIALGLGMRRDGFNIYALGPSGTGKRSVILHLMRQRAADEPTPADWIYVNNFADPHRPNAIQLPPGRGGALRQDMRSLIEELRVAIPAAFESEDYRTRRHVIDGQFKERHDKLISAIEQRAKAQGVGIIRTPMGMGLAPVRNGEVLAPEQFAQLPAEEQERLQQEMEAIHQQLQEVMQQLPRWESERRAAVRDLNREIIRFAIGHLIQALKERYADLPDVTEHLKVVEEDLAENAEEFLLQRAAMAGDGALEAPVRGAGREAGTFDRYLVNLIVDHANDTGAPVLEEDHPSLSNLIGRIEHRSMFGTLVTDFSLIMPGALHKANGGYLVLDARRLLLQPFAWDELKRTMRAREIRIRSAPDLLSLPSASTLDPEPIPCDVKVVLTGDRLLYYLLSEYDPEFGELFKVAADFDDEMARSADSELAYAGLIAGIASREKLQPLDRGAVARMIEHGARLAGDAERLSVRLEGIADLMREADHYARQEGRPVTAAADIQAAIDAQIRRASRIRERVLDEIARGVIMIDSAGAKVGQVNGLSVTQLGGIAFGRPSRITARVRLGKGEVVDIEREVELGGPIHSKGVLILAGFLGGRFARRRPLALSASLVFEQSYGGVEGDSASMAELCAILSMLAGVPIGQNLAITGSVNQNGESQPIGGVNEKIEGFFDVCLRAGLDGRQGVVIPAANVKHLMLRQDVVDAVAAGRFAVHAVAGVDQAMEILTGVEAGVPDAAGKYPPDSVNGRVEAELAALADRAQQFAVGERKGDRA
ncbi:MAG: AAA family ATPase [Alphaproteobacteria bacterium]|nr:AAA family ATPase [Alphaproteobacteria bacterium]